MSRRRAADGADDARSAQDQREGPDRRARERRAPRNRFDQLFAATLINQIAKPEAPAPRAYENPKPRRRKGVVVNLKT
jgi:hypothetical protein